MRQRRRPLGRALGGDKVALQVVDPALRHAGLHQLQAAADADQQVVEVVRQPARELPHRLHLLRLPEHRLRLGQRLGLLLFNGDIARDGVDQPGFRHRGPGQPAVAAAFVSVAVLEARGGRALGRPARLGQRGRGIVGMDQLHERMADQVVLLPAQQHGPGRVHGDDRAVEARHQHQVGRVPPHAVALGRALGDAGLQRLVQPLQRLLRALLRVDVSDDDQGGGDLALGVEKRDAAHPGPSFRPVRRAVQELDPGHRLAAQGARAGVALARQPRTAFVPSEPLLLAVSHARRVRQHRRAVLTDEADANRQVVHQRGEARALLGEPRFARPQRLLRPALPLHVGEHGDRGDDAVGLVAHRRAADHEPGDLGAPRPTAAVEHLLLLDDFAALCQSAPKVDPL